jgi:hypothetical protein
MSRLRSETKASGSSAKKTKRFNEAFQFSLDDLGDKKRVSLPDLNTFISERELKLATLLEGRQAAIATILLDMFNAGSLCLVDDAPEVKQVGEVMEKVSAMISASVKSLETKLSDMAKQVQSLADTPAITTAMAQTAAAAAAYQQYDGRQPVADHTTQVQTIKDELQMMQDQPKQQEYDNDLMMFRHKEADNETSVDLKSTVVDILSKLTDNCVQDDDIVQVFRVGSASKGKVRPVCVVFSKTARKQRTLVLKNKSKLRQVAPHVFVDVRLTPLQLKIRQRKQPIYDALLKEGQRPFWRYDKLFKGMGPNAVEVHAMPSAPTACNTPPAKATAAHTPTAQ